MADLGAVASLGASPRVAARGASSPFFRVPLRGVRGSGCILFGSENVGDEGSRVRYRVVEEVGSCVKLSLKIL